MHSRKQLNDRRDFLQSFPEDIRRAGGSGKKKKPFTIEILLQGVWKTHAKYSREDGARQALYKAQSPNSIWGSFKLRLLKDKQGVIA